MNIKDMKDFDENSSYYAGLKSKIDKLVAAFDEKEAKRKETFLKSIEQDNANLKAVKDALWGFADKNDEVVFDGKKTYKNEFVTAKKQASTKLICEDKNKTLKTIKTKFKNFKKRFIKVTEKVDIATIKSAIKSQELDDKKLAKLGLELKEDETLTIKPN